MLTNNHLPMLCAVATGSIGSSNSYERQDRIERYLAINARQDKITKVRERRALRRHEAGVLDDEFLLHFDDATPTEAFRVHNRAFCLDMVSQEDWAPYASTGVATFGWDVTEPVTIIDAIVGDADVDDVLAQIGASYDDLAAAVMGEGADVDTSALYGTTFDPTECGWGFTVSDRPVGSHGGTVRKAGARDEAGRWLAKAEADLAAA